MGLAEALGAVYGHCRAKRKSKRRWQALEGFCGGRGAEKPRGTAFYGRSLCVLL